MHHQESAVERGDIVGEFGVADVFEELALDLEGASVNLDGRDALRFDLVETFCQKIEDMRRIKGGADAANALNLRNLSGGLEHRGAAKTMSDEERGCRKFFAHKRRGGHEVFDVGGEVGVAEVAL